MTVTEFRIIFERPVYYPGQTVTGQVIISLDKPKEINGVELKIKGRTKFSWSESESYTDSEGKSQTRTVTRKGKESYLRNEVKLVGKTELTIGVHTYSFAVMLPPNIPSTFKGKYGGIAYYGKAKIDIPWAIDKSEKNFFQVENPLDLNHFPHLKNATKQENSKTFCCFCCKSGPLTLVVYIPKTGYVKTESIPITVEIDNASNVNVESVKASLSRSIHWKASGDSKTENDKIAKIGFGDVSGNSSKTWSENMALNCGPFPNIKCCNIISIEYKLEVEADPSGAHTDLEVYIPLTIGDIPFYDGENCSGQPSVAIGYPQVNPAPGGFMPSDTGCCYPNADGMNNPNIGFNPVVPAPYPSTHGGTSPSPYPSAPDVNRPAPPYPSAPVVTQTPNPLAPGGNPQGPYPPAQAPYEQPAQYPSAPYVAGNAQNGLTGYNPAAGACAPPPATLPGGNSVVYPPSGGSQNSAFYDPNASSANSTGLFNESSVVMPTSSFLGDRGGGINVNTPLLPPAPSAPSN